MRAPSFKNVDRLVNLGIAIQSYRRQSGLSQDQLAEKAGVSRATISDIEAPGTVRNFSIDCLFSIADVFDVPASVLLKRAEDFAK